mmetsp:Transcript_118729/g.335872  ORF Transcript_118729/g.335872 Transcript_118729/m.335872 type:complete len:354 (-) Transcript_118729:425-1486(-)
MSARAASAAEVCPVFRSERKVVGLSGASVRVPIREVVPIREGVPVHESASVCDSVASRDIVGNREFVGLRELVGDEESTPLLDRWLTLEGFLLLPFLSVFATGAATAAASGSTFSRPKRSTRNATGCPRPRSILMRSQRSSKHSTRTPPISRIKSPSCHPHFAPPPCTRMTMSSCSSRPRGFFSGSSFTMILTSSRRFLPTSSGGGLFMTEKRPILSLWSSSLSFGSSRCGGSRLSCKRMTFSQLANTQMAQQHGTIKASHNSKSPARSKLSEIWKLSQKLSFLLGRPGRSVVGARVVFAPTASYTKKCSRMGEHPRVTHELVFPQQYSVVPEHKVSHITGSSRGHWPRPRRN